MANGNLYVSAPLKKTKIESPEWVNKKDKLENFEDIDTWTWSPKRTEGKSPYTETMRFNTIGSILD